MALDDIPRRQLDIAFASWFEVEPESSAPFNQVEVQAGVFFNLATKTPYVMAAQTSGAFAVVTAPGRYRYDLVYLDQTGVVQIQQGNEQVGVATPYTGAPGDGAGPAIVGTSFPLAYVLIEEDVTVDIQSGDITDLRGVFQNTLNMDATNPADVDLAAAPGSAEIAARRDHVHQLSAALQTALAAPYDKGSTLFWTIRTDLPGNINARSMHWILHKFQGRAANDPNVWFNLNVGTEEVLELWPVDFGGTGNNIGLGFADDTDPLTAVFQNGWVYVYLIGNPTSGAAALVYSTNGPSVGPGLTDPAFAGYTVWRLITCIEGDAAGGDPVAIPAMKMDNMVIKQTATGATGSGTNVGGHVEGLLWTAGLVPTPISVAEHVSPIGIAVFFNLWAYAENNTGAGTGTVVAKFQPDFTTPTPVVPHLASITDWNDAFKQIEVVANSNGSFSDEHYVYDGFWMTLSELRTFLLDININGIGTEALGLSVLAYIEVNDHDLIDFDYTL